MRIESKLLLTFILSGLFVSCENMYKSTEEVDWAKEKTSMKPFTHIKEPIVITVDLNDKYTLFGKKSENCEWVDIGDIFVVYDWENDYIHDWAYFEEGKGLSNWRCAELGNNPTKYYDASQYTKKIGELDPETGKISVYDSVTSVHVPGILMSMNNNNKVKSRYGLINSYSSSNYYYVFDSYNYVINENPIKLNSVSLFYPLADSQGNYWISTLYEDKMYINEISPHQNKVIHSEYICDYDRDNSCEYLILVLVTDKYLFFCDNHYPYSKNLYYLERNNISNGYKLLQILPDDNKDFFIYMGVEINNICYMIQPVFDKSLFYINYCDIENRTLKRVTTGNFDFTETIYVRGTRIYFINSRNQENFVFTYYDTAADEWGDIQTYTCEQIIKGKY